MKILIDMNLSPRWVAFLADAGHQAVHWSSIGPGDAPDLVLIAHAREQQTIILTQDLDFGTLLAISGASLPSVVQVRAQATLPTDIGRQVLAALDASDEYLRAGALVTVNPTSHRVSVLPLTSAHSD